MMRSFDVAGLRRAACVAAVLALALPGAARADSRLEAHYRASVAGLTVGNTDIAVVIGSAEYTSAVRGRASGLLRTLVTGEGTLGTRGTVLDDRLVPASFSARTVGDDETSAVTMTLEGGDATEVTAETSDPDAERVPVTPEHRKGIVDPLSALLVPMGGTGAVAAAEACRRTLPIFDGRRRFDLVLSFRRIDQVKAKGYAGPAVVCAVAFKAIAGQKVGSPLVKYLAGREIELSLAPIAGTRLLAPFRLSIANMLGDIVVQATAFKSTTTPADGVAEPAVTIPR
jgi:Protein of unknown function (DUF3108)